MKFIKKKIYEAKINKYVNENKFGEISNIYDNIIALYPNKLTYKFNKMQILIAGNRLEEANIIADLLIKSKSRNSTYYFQKALIVNMLKRHEDAIYYYDKGIQLDKYNYDAYISKGVALACIKRYNDAIICYDKAIKIAPNKAYWAYCNKAVAYLRQGVNYNKALELCNIAIKLKKNNTDDLDYAYYVKSRIYALMNKKSDCLDSLYRAIEINKKWKEIVCENSDFDSLKGSEEFEQLIQGYK